MGPAYSDTYFSVTLQDGCPRLICLDCPEFGHPIASTKELIPTLEKHRKTFRPRAQNQESNILIDGIKAVINEMNQLRKGSWFTLHYAESPRRTTCLFCEEWVHKVRPLDTASGTADVLDLHLQYGSHKTNLGSSGSSVRKETAASKSKASTSMATPKDEQWQVKRQKRG